MGNTGNHPSSYSIRRAVFCRGSFSLQARTIIYAVGGKGKRLFVVICLPGTANNTGHTQVSTIRKAMAYK